MPVGAAARAPMPHCSGGGRITAVALFADENGRIEPAETAAAGRRHHGGRRLELLAAAAAVSTTATAAAATATPTAATTSATTSAAHQDRALRDGRVSRRAGDRRQLQQYQRYQPARPVRQARTATVHVYWQRSERRTRSLLHRQQWR